MGDEQMDGGMDWWWGGWMGDEQMDGGMDHWWGEWMVRWMNGMKVWTDGSVEETEKYF